MFRIRQDYRSVATRRAILNNSLTVKIGDVIIPLAASSAVTNATAALAGDFYPLGIVVGFSKANGEVIGVGTDPANTPAQLITAADNLTVAKLHAVYIPITEEMEFSAILSAVAGTSNVASATAFVWFNLTDARTVNEASWVVYTGIVGQILSLGVDPEDVSNKTIICRFAKRSSNRP